MPGSEMRSAGRRILQGCVLCTHESRSMDNFLGLMAEQWCPSGEDFEVELLTGGGEQGIEKWGGGSSWAGWVTGTGTAKTAALFSQKNNISFSKTYPFPFFILFSVKNVKTVIQNFPWRFPVLTKNQFSIEQIF